MFNPYLSQREKEIDRQEALARAERNRLARLAKGHTASRRWQLPSPVAAAFRLKALLARLRHPSRLERAGQR